MKFYDWLFASQANHDLFEYGVEGVQWNAVGDNQYETIPDENGKTYNFDAFVLSWLPSMTRYAVSTPEDVVAYLKVLADPSTFFKDPGSGFSFVDENVSSEAAKISSINDLAMVIKDGFESDIESAIEKVDQKRENAGLDTYAQEYTAQFDAFLAEHPYNQQ